MFLTREMQSLVRNRVRTNPLAEGEVQRIEGMGELYISLSDEGMKEKGYTFMYSLEIDGVAYRFYSRLGDD